MLGNALFALGPTSALRLDMGFERIGLNGTSIPGLVSNHVSRFFSGLGARILVPISPTVAFVSGRTGAVQFGHFNNVGDSGTGLYSGASTLPDASSDFLVVSAGDNSSSTVIGVNLPAGLLFQVDPHLALSLFAGYSAVFRIPSSGSSDLLHFVPIGLEAVVTPSTPLDFGLRFFFDGYVGRSGGSGTLNGPGYFDTRALMLWFRFRV